MFPGNLLSFQLDARNARLLVYWINYFHISRVAIDSRAKRGVYCRATETQIEPDGNDDKVFVTLQLNPGCSSGFVNKLKVAD